MRRRGKREGERGARERGEREARKSEKEGGTRDRGKRVARERQERGKRVLKKKPTCTPLMSHP